MRVVITGASQGIGLATAIKFLENGHEVVGIDILEGPEKLRKYRTVSYTHLRAHET